MTQRIVQTTDPFSFTRRECLRRVGRYAALGLVTATAAGLIGRSLQSDDASCVNRGLCSRCGQLSDCRLPLAVHFKAGPRFGDHHDP